MTMPAIRKLAPVAAATIGLTGAVAGALPAQATTRDNRCALSDFCFYYSTGSASADYARYYSFVYPDLSDNCYLHDTVNANDPCYNDKYAINGNGAGKEVRNDAHTMANNQFSPDYVFSAPD